MTINVAVVTDQDMTQFGVEHHVSEQPDMRFVGGFADLDTFCRSAVAQQTDVLLLDDHLPGLSVTQALKIVVAPYPQARVLLLGARLTPRGLRKALVEGAAGVVCKHEPLHELLLLGIRHTYGGERYLSPRAALVFAEEEPRLPRRQRQMLDLLAQHYEIPDIAVLWDVQPGTAYSTRRDLRASLGVERNEQILPEARRRGLIDDE